MKLTELIPGNLYKPISHNNLLFRFKFIENHNAYFQHISGDCPFIKSDNGLYGFNVDSNRPVSWIPADSNSLFTKETRLKHYKLMLDEITNHSNSYVGFCLALSSVTYPSNTISNYPELMKYVPERTNGSYWFHLNETGRKKRIDILNQIISELKIKTTMNKKIKDVIKLKAGNKFLNIRGNLITSGNWNLTKIGDVWVTNAGAHRFSETTIRENPELFEDVYEEETRKIIVEIEQSKFCNDYYSVSKINEILRDYVPDRNIKVTEIKPLTKEDALWIANGCSLRPFETVWAEFQAKKEAENGK